MIGFLIALLSLSCIGLAVLLWLLNARLAKVESILRARHEREPSAWVTSTNEDEA